MQAVDCEQGSEEWFAARRGVPSASSFKKICTTTGKLSSSADAYIDQLIKERVTGETHKLEVSEKVQAWMDRGTALEGEARLHYQLMQDVEVKEVGFVLHDEISVGCSPDGIMLIDGCDVGLEIKCPLWTTHSCWLRKGKLPIDHKQQVQGSMFVTGFSEWHFYSYHPDFDEQLLIKVKRDDAYIEEMEKHLKKVASEVKKFSERYRRAQ